MFIIVLITNHSCYLVLALSTVTPVRVGKSHVCNSECEPQLRLAAPQTASLATDQQKRRSSFNKRRVLKGFGFGSLESLARPSRVHPLLQISMSNLCP